MADDNAKITVCDICGKPGKMVMVLEGDRKVCEMCAPRVQKAREYAERKAAEAAQQARMIQEGLCNFCAKTSFCEMVAKFGECKPGDRCTDFVNKEGMKRKDIERLKKYHSKVPSASESPKPKNIQAQPPKEEDIYSWILKQDLNEEEQKKVAKMIDEIDDETVLKKEITKMLLGRKK
jgi:hypothetical protein